MRDRVCFRSAAKDRSPSFLWLRAAGRGFVFITAINTFGATWTVAHVPWKLVLVHCTKGLPVDAVGCTAPSRFL
jgi:hypothetical protein